MGILAKTLLYLGLFALLHFGYEATGWEVLRPVFGGSESVFEHLKMGFFAYLFASLLEFGSLRRRPVFPRGFWFSRLLATWAIPWMIVTTWYLVPGLFGRPLPLALELAWALGVTFLSGIFGGVLERGVEDERSSPFALRVVLVLFSVAAFFFVWFTYRTPWVDLFEIP
ncbi:hypothetical protein ACP6EK_01040 [Candidatus Caldatribacterium sp. SIUC1]|uniref:hypothetical protein n=1 Tax=Candidatus Caldatribacterium sp. SIUC1 TaxID=3418365 RepID=UPI003F68FB83